MRAKYNEFVAATPIAEKVSFCETMTDPAPGWWCEPAEAIPGRVIVFIHGRGYGLGSAKAYRGLASQIASSTKTSIFILQYPLAPEATVPTAIDFAVSAITRLSSEYKVAVFGDSAGGGLGLASTALVASKIRSLAAVAAFSPWTDLTLSGETMRSMAIGDILLDPDYLRQSALNYAGSRPLNDPQCSPLFGIPENMPPILIQVGTDEILLDDSVRYAEAAVSIGNNVE
jgi:monoterpene epsilon-lactone hydrolase